MATDTKEIALKAAKIALNPSSYLLDMIVESTSKKVSEAEEQSKVELTELRVQAERQQLEMQIAEAQARVAQEVAIAKRIETADKVEMEEFYDYSGTAQAGISTDGTNISIGANGTTKRVSKRIYRFTTKSNIEVIESKQKSNNTLEDE